MKFRTKTLLVVLPLIVATGMTITIVSYIISRNIVRRQIHDHLETAAHSRAQQVKTVLNEFRNTSEMLAAGSVLRDAVDPAIDISQSLNQVNRRIAGVIRFHEEISRIRLLDKTGRVIASSHRDVGLDMGTDELFIEGQKGIHVGDLHLFQFTGDPVLSVVAPILFSGEFAGIIVINFDAEEELFKITADRTGLGETGEIYLVNKDGYVITPSRFVDNAVLKQKVDTPESRECWELFGEEEEIEREEIDSYESYHGETVVGTHYRIEEMDWCLLAEMSTEEAFAPIAKLTRTMFSILAILSVVGITLAIFLSGAITRPIVKLHHGVEEIEKGNLDCRVGTQAKDEIGQLSRVFDAMILSLKESREELEDYSKDLEKKVEERTVKLKEQFIGSEEQRIATQNILRDFDEANKNLELEITERKEAEKLQASIYRISEVAHSAQNLEGFFRLIHRIIGELMPAKNFYIALYDTTTETLSFPYFIDERDEIPEPKKLGRGMTEYVLRTEKPLLASPEVFEKLVREEEVEIIGTPTIDWLGVPLKTKDKTIGVLAVQSYIEGVRFEEKDKDILTFVSTQVAMAIERKRAEEALKRAKAELEEWSHQLEDKVRERTQELKETQEKLIHSERLAAIGQLAANIAHELRHPLAILQNSAYFLDLTMEGDDEKVKKHLAIMKKETLRADGIISALLSFSRKMESHFVPIKLNEVIERVLSEMTAPQGVEVVTDLGDIPTVFADGEQLQSIFVNLISNGIQAMPDGGTLEIVTSPEDGFVRVEVSDAGVGIPKRNLARIFEPLFSTRSFGVGLGLCITKRLIENHGGTIEVQSKLNVGTTFVVRIPVERRKGR